MNLYRIKDKIKTKDGEFNHYYTKNIGLDEQLNLNYDEIDLDLTLISINNDLIIYNGNPIHIIDQDVKSEILDFCFSNEISYSR